MTRKIGIYPGTFDPLHKGHLAFAAEAQIVCELDEVVFLPEGSPREKFGVAGISERMASISAATERIDGSSVVHLNHERFTVHDTLPLLQQRFADCELTLFIGSDVVRTFLYRWENLDTLLREMPIAIGMREGDTTDEMATIIGSLEKDYGFTIRYTVVNSPYSDVSSTQIRNTFNSFQKNKIMLSE
jgi:nicotinate-nucleotide adenylyltransferase